MFMTTVLMFPGQGSQVVGMGADVLDKFGELEELADTILGYSIRKLCLRDPEGLLGQTQYTQPALFVVNTLSYLWRIRRSLPHPRCTLGHSLGEYSALYAADVFDFEIGLRLVQKRGELMAKATGGAMTAVVGLTEEKLLSALEAADLQTVSIANFNTYTQQVISGPADDVKAAEPVLKQAGAKLVIPLKVSGAFHSQAMKSAKGEFAKFLSTFTLSSPKIPVYANLTGRPYPKLESEIKTTLAEQITHQVSWVQSISAILTDFPESQFEECGSGTVLTGLLKRIRNNQ